MREENIELGNKIKMFRKTRELKQSDLGKCLGLSKGEISNIEKGRRGVSLFTLKRLCKQFNVDISYFICEESSEEGIKLVDNARVLFNSKKLSNIEKENLFASLTKVYLDSKGD